MSTNTLTIEDITANKNGFTIFPIKSTDAFSVIRAAGDFNGDGLSDISICSYNAFPQGECYVVLGKKDVSSTQLDLSKSIEDNDAIVLLATLFLIMIL